MGRSERQTLPQLLDIEAVAEHLGVTVRHVRRLVYERRIPYVKWGHLLRFDPTTIAEWLEEARVAAGETPDRPSTVQSAGLRAPASAGWSKRPVAPRSASRRGPVDGSH